MSISYSPDLSWHCFHDGYQSIGGTAKKEPITGDESQARRAGVEVLTQTTTAPLARGEQYIRDVLRLVLKVWIRSIWTPVVLPKHWKQRERAKINVKLACYSFAQLGSVPVKFLVALAALATSAISADKAKLLLDKSEGWTTYLDGRASQLEALKEEGLGRRYPEGAPRTRKEYEDYKEWLYKIDPRICCLKG
jgi:hypothetical protein